MSTYFRRCPVFATITDDAYNISVTARDDNNVYTAGDVQGFSTFVEDYDDVSVTALPWFFKIVLNCEKFFAMSLSWEGP